MQVGQEQMGTSRELLTLTLGFLKVRKLCGREAEPTIVNAPEFIKGVINLRKTVVPVVDRRIKFRLGRTCDESSVVSILNTASRLVVDAVSGVITPGRTKSIRRVSSGRAWTLSTCKAARLTRMNA